MDSDLSMDSDISENDSYYSGDASWDENEEDSSEVTEVTTVLLRNIVPDADEKSVKHFCHENGIGVSALRMHFATAFLKKEKFAYIDLSNPFDLEFALELDGKQFQGRQLSVVKALSKNDNKSDQNSEMKRKIEDKSSTPTDEKKMKINSNNNDNKSDQNSEMKRKIEDKSSTPTDEKKMKINSNNNEELSGMKQDPEKNKCSALASSEMQEEKTMVKGVTRIHVGKLTNPLTVEDLKNFFKEHGVELIWVRKKIRQTFAFVDLPTTQLSKALAMNGIMFRGKNVLMDVCNPQKENEGKSENDASVITTPSKPPNLENTGAVKSVSAPQSETKPDFEPLTGITWTDGIPHLCEELLGRSWLARNLAHSTTEEELKASIAKCLNVIMPMRGHCNRGFAYIIFPSKGIADSSDKTGIILRGKKIMLLSASSTAMKPKVEVKTKFLHIKGLLGSTTEDDLKRHFPKTVNIKLLKYPGTQKSKGKGYLEFDSLERAESILMEWDGKEIDGKEIELDFWKPFDGREDGLKPKDQPTLQHGEKGILDKGRISLRERKEMLEGGIGKIESGGTGNIETDGNNAMWGRSGMRKSKILGRGGLVKQNIGMHDSSDKRDGRIKLRGGSGMRGRGDISSRGIKFGSESATLTKELPVLGALTDSPQRGWQGYHIKKRSELLSNSGRGMLQQSALGHIDNMIGLGDNLKGWKVEQERRENLNHYTRTSTFNERNRGRGRGRGLPEKPSTELPGRRNDESQYTNSASLRIPQTSEESKLTTGWGASRGEQRSPRGILDRGILDRGILDRGLLDRGITASDYGEQRQLKDKKSGRWTESDDGKRRGLVDVHDVNIDIFHNKERQELQDSDREEYKIRDHKERRDVNTRIFDSGKIRKLLELDLDGGMKNRLDLITPEACVRDKGLLNMKTCAWTSSYNTKQSGTDFQEPCRFDNSVDVEKLNETRTGVKPGLLDIRDVDCTGLKVGDRRRYDYLGEKMEEWSEKNTFLDKTEGWGKSQTEEELVNINTDSWQQSKFGERRELFEQAQREQERNVFEQAQREQERNVFEQAQREQERNVFEQAQREQERNVFEQAQREQERNVFEQAQREQERNVFEQAQREQERNVFEQAQREQERNVFEQAQREQERNVFEQAQREQERNEIIENLQKQFPNNWQPGNIEKRNDMNDIRHYESVIGERERSLIPAAEGLRAAIGEEKRQLLDMRSGGPNSSERSLEMAWGVLDDQEWRGKAKERELLLDVREQYGAEDRENTGLFQNRSFGSPEDLKAWGRDAVMERLKTRDVEVGDETGHSIGNAGCTEIEYNKRPLLNYEETQTYKQTDKRWILGHPGEVDRSADTTRRGLFDANDKAWQGYEEKKMVLSNSGNEERKGLFEVERHQGSNECLFNTSREWQYGGVKRFWREDADQTKNRERDLFEWGKSEDGERKEILQGGKGWDRVPTGPHGLVHQTGLAGLQHEKTEDWNTRYINRDFNAYS